MHVRAASGFLLKNRRTHRKPSTHFSCVLCDERLANSVRSAQTHYQTHHLLSLSRAEASRILTARQSELRISIRKVLTERLGALVARQRQNDRKAGEEHGPSAVGDGGEHVRGRESACRISSVLRSPQWDGLTNGAQAHGAALKLLAKRKWAALCAADIHFGLEEDRDYFVEVEVPALRRIGLVRLTYNRSQQRFPIVNVDLRFQDDTIIPLRLTDGHIVARERGFTTYLTDAHQLLLTVVSLFYYLDILSRQQRQKPVAEPRVANEDAITCTGRDKSTAAARRRAPTIPRYEAPYHHPPPAATRDGHQPSISSRVSPFIRRLPPGSSPSLEKVIEADRYGFVLEGPGYPDVRYTWVAPHWRGTPSSQEALPYRDGSASRILGTLLDALLN